MEHEKKLRFREDGTFKIVQFTDLHWHNGDEKDQSTLQLTEKIIAKEQPDLVVYTGDVIGSMQSVHPPVSFLQATEAPERLGVPWTVVFGNHDADKKDFDKEELMEAVLTRQHCFAKAGPSELHGLGNHALTVTARDGSAGGALFMLDSGQYDGDDYEWIHTDQIQWYVKTSEAMRHRWGRTIPALAFFHIPLPEYDTVWETGNCVGRKGEKVCSPKLNSGFFTAMVEQGDVMATFVGHDHVNDYCGEYRRIRLCYGLKTGYNGYPHNDPAFKRGGRVIVLHENERRFDTWLHHEDHNISQVLMTGSNL
ncbi:MULTISPECIES: metallophosphoesterase family protein [Paenibacillus]|uniref:Metallophosphoesterase n=1 Tax=Paenibacillus oceani TaxID=2772510 RepID=A0A927CF84_9BACL|nr:metallophosphoesterase family protein [Paenibacillus oceani]MBD2866379.1 metallophosphoesterase [Paenibacillus oceani]